VHLVIVGDVFAFEAVDEKDAVAFAVGGAVVLPVEDGERVAAAVPDALTDADTPKVSDAVTVAEDELVTDEEIVAAAVPDGEPVAARVSVGEAARLSKVVPRHSASATRHARMAKSPLRKDQRKGETGQV
jgi:hypothetical protein